MYTITNTVNVYPVIVLVSSKLGVYIPVAAEALWCLSHTEAEGLSSGSHASGADEAAHSSASYLPVQQTNPENKV